MGQYNAPISSIPGCIMHLVSLHAIWLKEWYAYQEDTIEQKFGSL